MDAAERDLKARSFGSVADYYERGRPGYPAETIAWLCERGGTNIVDLGAGTGKLTRQLAESAREVVAVEPSLEMLMRLLPDGSIVRVCAAAEAIPVRPGWADTITVAQAFHWFDIDRAIEEIHRVLRPHGTLGLIWNLRDDSVDWVAELSDVIGSLDAHVSGVADSDRYGFDPSHGFVSKSGLFTGFERRVFRHSQRLDVEGLVALVQSRSNVVMKPEGERRELADRVRRLCRDHPTIRGRETFDLPYKTHVFRAAARTQ